MDNTKTLAGAQGNALSIALHSETLLTISKSIFSKPFSVIEQTLIGEIFNPRLKRAITNYFSPSSNDAMPSPTPSPPVEDDTSSLSTTTENHQLAVASNVEDSPEGVETESETETQKTEHNTKIGKDEHARKSSLRVGDIRFKGDNTTVMYWVDGTSTVTISSAPIPTTTTQHQSTISPETIIMVFILGVFCLLLGAVLKLLAMLS